MHFSPRATAKTSARRGKHRRILTRARERQKGVQQFSSFTCASKFGSRGLGRTPPVNQGLRPGRHADDIIREIDNPAHPISFIKIRGTQPGPSGHQASQPSVQVCFSGSTVGAGSASPTHGPRPKAVRPRDGNSSLCPPARGRGSRARPRQAAAEPCERGARAERGPRRAAGAVRMGTPGRGACWGLWSIPWIA